MIGWAEEDIFVDVLLSDHWQTLWASHCEVLVSWQSSAWGHIPTRRAGVFQDSLSTVARGRQRKEPLEQQWKAHISETQQRRLGRVKTRSFRLDLFSKSPLRRDMQLKASNVRGKDQLDGRFASAVVAGQQSFYLEKAKGSQGHCLPFTTLVWTNAE